MSDHEDFISIREKLDGASMSTYALVMIFVPLKIACRLSGGRQALGWDDVFILIGFAMSNTFFWTQFVGIRPLLGHHYGEFEIPELVQYLKYVFAAQLLYVSALAIIKASLLCFFWRLFSVRSKIPMLATAILVTCWAISANLLLSFSCDPPQAQWDITIADATCLNRRKTYLGICIPNVLTDVLLLVLPIPYVWSLHASMTQRMMLVSIFVLGGFVSVVSIVRLSILMGLDLTSADVTYNLSMVFVWSSIEINIGLVCACLPSLKPAVQWLGLSRLFSNGSKPRSRPSGHIEPSPYSDDRSRGTNSKKKGGYGIFSALANTIEEEEDSFQMIGQHHNVHGKTDTNVDVVRTSSDTERDSHRGGLTAMPAIKVQKQWNISVDQQQAERAR